jgi:hypothetical protein
MACCAGHVSAAMMFENREFAEHWRPEVAGSHTKLAFLKHINLAFGCYFKSINFFKNHPYVGPKIK